MKFYPEMRIETYSNTKPGMILSVPGPRDSLVIGLTVEPHQINAVPDLIIFPSFGSDKAEEFHVISGHVFQDGPVIVYSDPFITLDPAGEEVNLQSGTSRSEGAVFLFENRLAVCAVAKQISPTARPIYYFDTGTRPVSSNSSNAMFARWSISVLLEGRERLTLVKVRQP